MSSVVAVRVDASDLKRTAAAYRIGGKLVDVALARAINRGGDAGAVETRRALVKNTGIKASDTRRSKGLTKKLATPSKPEFKLQAASSYTPLSYFSPTQAKDGVRARPWNRTQTFVGTFFIRMSSGYVGVFRRDRTAARAPVTTRSGRRINAQPIKELWGPSLAVEMMKGDVPDTFRRVSSERTMERLPTEISFALDKALKGPKRRR